MAQKLLQSYKLAMKGDEAQQWTDTCDKEISILKHMRVWSEVDLPSGKQAVSSKWVFNQKTNAEGVVVKHKARFVV